MVVKDFEMITCYQTFTKEPSTRIEELFFDLIDSYKIKTPVSFRTGVGNAAMCNAYVFPTPFHERMANTTMAGDLARNEYSFLTVAGQRRTSPYYQVSPASPGYLPNPPIRGMRAPWWLLVQIIKVL